MRRGPLNRITDMKGGHFSIGPAEMKMILDKMTGTCYIKYGILEVFAFTEATKTFDFVAFFLLSSSEILLLEIRRYTKWQKEQ